MSPPTRRSGPVWRAASHQTSGGGPDTARSTPPGPDHEYDELVAEVEGESAPLTDEEWAQILADVEAGVLDPDEVGFDRLPPEHRPLAAFRGSDGRWRYAG